MCFCGAKECLFCILSACCFAWHDFLFLVGSKSNVSGFFRLQFRNGLGTKPAGALLFRMRSPSTFFLGFAWWLAGFQVVRCAKVFLARGNLFSVFLQASKSYVAQKFSLLEGTFFLCFYWVLLGGLQASSGFLFAWLGHDFFVFSGFQKQRFGIFQAAVSQWLGHKTCWGSAFSDALPKHLFLGFWEFGHGVVIRPLSLTLRKGFPCSRQLGRFGSLGTELRFGIFLAAASHGLGTISLSLVGSKSNVSGFFRLQFRNGLGTKPAGALLFRMRSPSTFFLGFATFREFGHGVVIRPLSLTLRKGFPCSRQLGRFGSLGTELRFGIFLAAVSHGLGTISLFLVGSKSNVSGFFRLQFRNGLGTKPAGALLFRMRSPSTFFLGFATFREFGHGVVIRPLSLTLHKGFPCSRQLGRFGSLGTELRFGIFLAAVSHGLGAISLFLVGSKSNVSGFFRLQFCNGLGTKPAGALLFRMRSPSTFFGIFQAAVSQWLGHKTCWGSAFSDALPKHLFLGFWHVSGVWARSRYQASKSYVAQRFSLFEATWTFREFGHGVAFRHFSGCGFAWLGHDFFVFSGFQIKLCCLFC